MQINVPHEIFVSLFGPLFREDEVKTLFASPIECMRSSVLGSAYERIQQCKIMIGRKGKKSITITVKRISAVGTDYFTLLTPSPSPPSRARVGVQHEQLFVVGHV